MKKLIIILLFLCSAVASAQWKRCENGLDGGMILCMISNEGRLIAGTKRGIFFSTDSGDNWTYSPGDDFGELSVTQISKFHAYEDKVFAASDNGLYYSTDNGENWQRTNYGYDPVVSVTVNKDFIFGSGLYGEVKRSSDGGQTWERIDEPIPQGYSPTLAFDYVYVYLGCNGGLYRTSDNGDNWEPITIDNSATRPIDFIKSISGKLYVNSSSTLYISQDLGASWQATDLDLSSNRIYDIATNGEYIFAATYSGVMRSKNGVTEWATTGEVERFETLSLAGRDGAIYAGTYDGVFRSGDDGNSWTKKSKGIRSIDVSAVYAKGGSVYAGSHYAGVLYSDDNGENWQSSSLKKDYIQSIDGSDNMVYVAGNFNINRWDRETDNWKDISAGASNVGANSFATSGSEVYAGGMNGVVYSSNYGESWKTPTLYTTISCLALSNGEALAGSASQTLLYQSKDKGQTWAPIIVEPGLLYLVHAVLVNSNRIYVGTNEGLYVSNDDGKNWSRSENGLLNDNIIKLASSGEHIFAGTIAGLYHSSDGGASWISVNRNLPFGEISMLSASDETVYAANTERGLYRANIADLFKGSAREPDSEASITLSPSPASEYVILPETKSPLSETSVYSILGVRVLTTRLMSGKLDVGALPPGLYFLEREGKRYKFVKE